MHIHKTRIYIYRYTYTYILYYHSSYKVMQDLAALRSQARGPASLRSQALVGFGLLAVDYLLGCSASCGAPEVPLKEFRASSSESPRFPLKGSFKGGYGSRI